MARPLKIFMRGKRITMLQEILRRMGYPMLDQAGQFGASTRDAVKDYQRQHDFKATGIVDDALLSLMQQGPLASSAKAKPSDSETAPTAPPVNQIQLDALIHLLVDKGIITEEELNKEIERPQTLRLQPPLL
ncbi:peptidoglycan-binding protein [Mariprofundus sp. EBB-1]|uniref:peptidoglycan-binding domain-containing protein n=1 Tax=Mariprofundus sp. EBB-1 TaxID=2650971 RepID=UPI000EF18F48|nr:peptidoglycan-binding domain-containing protein [Mariprofundus sp. EBB-1]RLL51264.1 peptidoglycan-binding protein [Mariprofundus sp. EBB-1]